jgi:very-short-patch-repair endonuclease
VGIEYDGENHRDRLVADNRRQNGLQRAGYTLLCYTRPMCTDAQV